MGKLPNRMDQIEERTLRLENNVEKLDQSIKENVKSKVKPMKGMCRDMRQKVQSYKSCDNNNDDNLGQRHTKYFKVTEKKFLSLEKEMLFLL